MRKFLLGLIAGITAGVLLAPKSGKEIRDELMASDDKFATFTKLAQAMGTEASDEVQKIMQSDDVKKLIAKGKTAAGDLIDTIEKKASEKGKTIQAEIGGLVNSAWAEVKKTTEKTTKKTAPKKKRAPRKRVAKKKSVTKKSDKKV